MLHLLRRTARNPWITGKRFSSIYLRSLHDLADQDPLPSSSSSHLAVSYLMSSCGLSHAAALSIANRINLKTTDNSNSVLALLASHGMTKSHISSIITKSPRVLFSDPESTIKPKLEFFLSVGVSNDALAKLITAIPSILLSNLDMRLRPNFEMLKTICGSGNVLLCNINRFSWLLQRNFEKEIFPNLKTLQDHGVPPSNIVRFSVLSPLTLIRNPAQFSKSIVSLKEMGFDPSKSHFIYGLKVVWLLSKAAWERRFLLYQSLGWSPQETISAFRKSPFCMAVSDEKIKRAFDIFSERMNWTPSFLATQPVLLSYSIEKTVLPRHKVMSILASKGLIRKKISMTGILRLSKKNFLEKYVMKYKDQAPEILEAYKDKLELEFSKSVSDH